MFIPSLSPFILHSFGFHRGERIAATEFRWNCRCRTVSREKKDKRKFVVVVVNDRDIFLSQRDDSPPVEKWFPSTDR